MIAVGQKVLRPSFAFEKNYFENFFVEPEKWQIDCVTYATRSKNKALFYTGKRNAQNFSFLMAHPILPSAFYVTRGKNSSVLKEIRTKKNPDLLQRKLPSVESLAV